MLEIETPPPPSLISLPSAVVFPVLLIAALYPLGLTGIWMNFPLTSVLAGVMSIVILKKLRAVLNRTDAPQEE